MTWETTVINNQPSQYVLKRDFLSVKQSNVWPLTQVSLSGQPDITKAEQDCKLLFSFQKPTQYLIFFHLHQLTDTAHGYK